MKTGLIAQPAVDVGAAEQKLHYTVAEGAS